MQGAVRGKRLRTTIPQHSALCPEDRVNRRFRAPRPNALWLADVAYLQL
jgi:putative transposase